MTSNAGEGIERRASDWLKKGMSSKDRIRIKFIFD
jgi:hypothetical protein